LRAQFLALIVELTVAAGFVAVAVMPLSVLKLTPAFLAAHRSPRISAFLFLPLLPESSCLTPFRRIYRASVRDSLSPSSAKGNRTLKPGSPDTPADPFEDHPKPCLPKALWLFVFVGKEKL